jgi:hypothetical protein
VCASMPIQAQVRGLDCQTAARPCAALALCRAVELHSGKENRPLFADVGPGDRPHFSSSPPSNRGGMARRQGAWPGLLRAVSGLRRTVGVKRHAPRLAARQRGIFGLRLSQRSGRTRSCLSLEGLSRGRPWVRIALVLARRCRSRSPLSRRLMKTPSSTDRDGRSIITLTVKSRPISLVVNSDA